MKRVFCLLLSFVLMATLFSSVSFADGTEPDEITETPVYQGPVQDVWGNVRDGMSYEELINRYGVYYPENYYVEALMHENNSSQPDVIYDQAYYDLTTVVIEAPYIDDEDMEYLDYQTDGFYVLTFDNEAQASAAMEKYEENPEAEVSYDAYAEVFDNGSEYYSYLSWGPDVINSKDMVTEILDTYGSVSALNTVVVGVIDSGVNTAHSLLADRINSNQYDFYDDDNDASDEKGHGSHVAGIIADTTLPNVKINGYKITDAEGKTSASRLTKAIDQAVSDGVDIINLSLGGKITYTTDADGKQVPITSIRNVYNALDKAMAQGIIVIIAAGNYGVDVSEVYPASYSDAIIVSALAKPGTSLASYSDYGAVDVCAPGSSIYSSSIPFSSYGYLNGTSMAAPFVTAAAALLKTLYPSFTRADVENFLVSNATDLGADGYDTKFGYGRIDLSVKTTSPVIDTHGGEYVSPVKVTITCEDKKADIYYTTDGSEPTSSSIKYSGPIIISSTTCLKAIAVRQGKADSETVSMSYYFDGVCLADDFVIENGIITEFTGDQTVLDLTSLDNSNITGIGSLAFYDEILLEKVIIPDNITSFETGAFGELEDLEIVLKGSIEKTGDYPFGYNAVIEYQADASGVEKLEKYGYTLNASASVQSAEEETAEISAGTDEPETGNEPETVEVIPDPSDGPETVEVIPEISNEPVTEEVISDTLTEPETEAVTAEPLTETEIRGEIPEETSQEVMDETEYSEPVYEEPVYEEPSAEIAGQECSINGHIWEDIIETVTIPVQDEYDEEYEVIISYYVVCNIEGCGDIFTADDAGTAFDLWSQHYSYVHETASTEISEEFSGELTEDLSEEIPEEIYPVITEDMYISGVNTETETVHHDAVYEYEDVVAGRRCAVCGVIEGEEPDPVTVEPEYEQQITVDEPVYDGPADVYNSEPDIWTEPFDQDEQENVYMEPAIAEEHVSETEEMTAEDELIIAAADGCDIHVLTVIYPKAATCSAAGSTKGLYCRQCGMVFIESTNVPATGAHTAKPVEGVTQTCQASGITRGTVCRDCGSVLDPQNVIPVSPHFLITDQGKDATCTEEGLTDGSHCSYCGSVVQAQEKIPALGHSWDEGTVIRAATAAVPGVIRYTCSRCGETKDETLYAPPEMVEKISAEPFDGGILVKWESAEGATSYKVYRRTETSEWSLIFTTEDTSYPDGEASEGTGYYYTVRGYNSETGLSGDYDKTGLWAAWIRSPGAPTVSMSSGKAVIKWNKVENASKYIVYRQAEGESGWKRLKAVDSTSYTDNTVVNGTLYHYIVIAAASLLNKQVYSGYSLPGTAGIYLEKPTVKTAKGVSAGIKVTWDKVSGADGYRVFRKAQGESKWTVVEAETAATAFTDTAVESGKIYYYTVRAYSLASGSEVWSTYDKTGKGAAWLSRPEAKATSGSGKAVIRWNAVTGASGYLVYRNAEGTSSWKRIAIVSNTKYTDTSLKTGVKYTYVIIAYGSFFGTWIKSGYSDGILAISLSYPVFRSAESVSNGIRISWDQVTGAEGYVLYRKAENAAGWKQAAIISGDTAYTDTDVEAGVRYYYTIRAYTTETGSVALSSYNRTGIAGIWKQP